MTPIKYESERTQQTGTFAKSKMSLIAKSTNGTLVPPTPDHFWLCYYSCVGREETIFFFKLCRDYVVSTGRQVPLDLREISDPQDPQDSQGSLEPRWGFRFRLLNSPSLYDCQWVWDVACDWLIASFVWLASLNVMGSCNGLWAYETVENFNLPIRGHWQSPVQLQRQANCMPLGLKH